MNNAETLPSELRMAAPPTIPQARSYLFKQKSEYTQYPMGKGTKIRINIPRLQRTYLSKDSYLRFRVNMEVKSPTTDQLPCTPVFLDRVGAIGLFDRIEVYDYLGATLIEQIGSLPALATLLRDIGTPNEAYDTKLSAMEGCDGSSVFANYGNAMAAKFSTSSSGKQLFSWNWNNASATSQIQSAFNTFEFAIPLYSFLGMFSNKFVPLHNGFSIDLFLNSPDNAFVSWYCCDTSDPTLYDKYLNWNVSQNKSVGKPDPNFPADPTKTIYFSNTGTIVESVTITNVEFCAQVMELGNDAENLVLSSNGAGPMVIHSHFYRYFTDIVKGNGEADQSSTFAADLNLNVVSLRNIRFGFRPLMYQNTIRFPSYGHRIRNYATSFNFQYGSSYLPELAGISCRSVAVPSSAKGSVYPYQFIDVGKMDSITKDEVLREGFTQAYAELLKTGAAGLLYNTSLNGSITGEEYATDVTSLTNNFYPDLLNVSPVSGNVTYIVPPMSHEKSTWSGKFAGGLDLRLSAKEVVSGIDTNGLLVRLNVAFEKSQLEKMVNAVVDIFCEHDAFVQIIPGVASTVTF